MAAVLVVGVVYLLQIATPLRIEYDSTEYFVLAAWIRDELWYPASASFPPGQPLLLAGLDAVGAASSHWIALVNTLLVGVGLAAVARVVRRDLAWGGTAVLAVVLATLLATPLIRWTPHPLSDPPFIGISLVAVALASEARRRASLWPILPAAVFALVAVSIRTFGIALVPALLAGLPTRRQRLVAGPAVAALGLGALAVLGPERYLGDAADRWRDGAVAEALDHVGDQLTIAGALSVNVPLDRAPAVAAWIYPAIGAAALGLAAVGAVAIRRSAPVVSTYVVAAGLLLLAWPFSDVRLALPILPLLIVCVGAGAVRLPVRARRAARVWAVGFAAAGVAALVFTTRITFAGDAFPERYSTADPAMMATYRVAWGVGDAADRRAALPRSLWVLRKFEARAVGEPGPPPEP